MLIFRDSILGLVAGVQLSANDMLRPGDWITMAKYGADGYVTEVSLTTVKVQNFDKTITTIPPYALVSDSFQNWRGMRECGGRRIKRSVLLDASTVRFCTPEETERLIKEGLAQKEDLSEDAVNMRIFRSYMQRYLKSNPGIRLDLLQMVRTAPPPKASLSRSAASPKRPTGFPTKPSKARFSTTSSPSCPGSDCASPRQLACGLQEIGRPCAAVPGE